MPKLRCFMDHLSFSWPGGRDILIDQNCGLVLDGVIALCGPNGCGKSTLLSLMAGQMRPTSGRFDLRGVLVRWIPQRIDGAARSPGQCQKERLGEILRQDESILLLDEPTNHLDRQGLVDMERSLRRRTWPTLVVSHDREFLDRVAASTWWLEEGVVWVSQGGFSAAWQARQERRSKVREAREAFDAKVRQVKNRLQAARESAGAANRDRTAGRRMKDANDRDATSMAADFKFRTAQKSKGREIERLGSALERMETESVIEVARDSLRDVRFPWDDRLASRKLALPAGDLTAPDGSRIGHGGVVVDGRMRVRLEGPNGSGKSTVLAALAASARDGVAYLPQEPDEIQDLELLRRLREASPQDRGRITTLAAALGASGDALLRTSRPSPGEARKLRVAAMLGGASWILLLDEPTNHLDAASIQVLQEALERWPGALVVATHDERLAMAVTRQTWSLRQGWLHQT
ncbi:MAG TPA: ATP-binding cassette domain-containing protein [Fibrobacteria bacterium]|nr:ATP-binding cassette domain-containing protein [Fibrobacteria bacterium]